MHAKYLRENEKCHRRREKKKKQCPEPCLAKHQTDKQREMEAGAEREMQGVSQQWTQFNSMQRFYVLGHIFTDFTAAEIQMFIWTALYTVWLHITLCVLVKNAIIV